MKIKPKLIPQNPLIQKLTFFKRSIFSLSFFCLIAFNLHLTPSYAFDTDFRGPIAFLGEIASGNSVQIKLKPGARGASISLYRVTNGTRLCDDASQENALLPLELVKTPGDQAHILQIKVKNLTSTLFLAKSIEAGSFLCVKAMKYYGGFSEASSEVMPARASTPTYQDEVTQFFNQSFKTCGEDFSYLDSLVSDYEQKASENNSIQSDELYHKISDVLSHQATRPECKHALELRYITDSLSSVDVIAKEWQKSERGGVGYYERTASAFRYGSRISNLVLSMYRMKKLVILSEEYRNQAGGHWLEKTDNSYLASGAYDCGTSVISLDPNQRPLDLALSVFHEFDHLIRDKTTSPEKSGFFQNGEIDWDAYNLYDEFSASAFSAGSQADIQGIQKGRTLSAGAHFKIENDLTSFHPNGLFMTLFERINILEPMKLYANTYITSQIFSEKNDLSSKVQQDKQVNTKINAIVEKIKGAYFSSKNEVPVLHKNTDGKSLIQWLARGDNQVVDSFGVSIESPPNVADDRFLLQTLETPSQICKLYENKILQGGMAGYLGQEFSTLDQPNAPASSIRPCLRMGRGL